VNIIAAIFMTLIAATALANSIYETPDAETRFKEAQRHVKELMDAGRYQDASKYMATYKTLACEAAEQKAGKSAEEGAAACASKSTPAGLARATVQPAESSADSLLGPGFTVRQRPMPGSSTLLDGSTPSLFVFDPRTVPGSGSSSRSDSGSSSKTDPWTGSP
jgi:hypothetical protein